MARTHELEDAARLDAADVVVEGPADHAGIRPLAAQPDRLFEQLRIQHKIRTFHVYRVHPTSAEETDGAGTQLSRTETSLLTPGSSIVTP